MQKNNALACLLVCTGSLPLNGTDADADARVLDERMVVLSLERWLEMDAGAHATVLLERKWISLGSLKTDADAADLRGMNGRIGGRVHHDLDRLGLVMRCVMISGLDSGRSTASVLRGHGRVLLETNLNG
jgi:hypothetical protein